MERSEMLGMVEHREIASRRDAAKIVANAIIAGFIDCEKFIRIRKKRRGTTSVVPQDGK
jgi:hypothetical protein